MKVLFWFMCFENQIIIFWLATGHLAGLHIYMTFAVIPSALVIPPLAASVVALFG